METTFKHIIDTHNGILYKISRSYTSNEVDFQELYQEILVQLWTSYPRFRQESKVSTWIYRVALNTAITFQKRQNKKRFSPMEAKMFKLADDTNSSLEREHKKGKRIDLLYLCINQLNKDDRAIILLHLEGKSYEETAEIIGITSNNVGVKLMRIKKKLYKLLNKHGYARI